MPRRERSSQRRTSASPVGYILSALGGIALGAGVTWWVMHDDLPTPRGALLGAPGPSAAPGGVAANSAPPSYPDLPPGVRAAKQGDWFYDQSRWSEAIVSYEAAIKLGEDNPDVRTDLGNCYRFGGQPTKALENYQIAQSQSGMHENSLLNLANLYQQVLNDPTKARSAWQLFLTRFPTSSNVQKAREALSALNSGVALPGDAGSLVDPRAVSTGQRTTPIPAAPPAAPAPDQEKIKAWMEKTGGK